MHTINITLLMLLTISPCYGAAQSTSTLFDHAHLVSYYPGGERKKLIVYTQRSESTLICKVALLDSSTSGIFVAETEDLYNALQNGHSEASQITLINNHLKINRPEKTIDTYASLFACGNTGDMIRPHEPLKRYLLLTGSQPDSMSELLAQQLAESHRSTRIEMMQRLNMASADHAYALIDLAAYLEMYAGYDWQVTLPIALYKNRLVSQTDIERIEKIDLAIKAFAVGSIVGAGTIIAGLIVYKKYYQKK